MQRFFITLIFIATAFCAAHSARAEGLDVTITQMVPTQTSAEIRGTVMKTAGGPATINTPVSILHNVTVGTNNFTGAKTTTGYVTGNSGTFTVSLHPLDPGTKYIVKATAGVATMTGESEVRDFTTNPPDTSGTSEFIDYNNPQPNPGPTTITLKFKVSGLIKTKIMTVNLLKDGVVAKSIQKSVAPDISGNALFEAAFTGLTQRTSYDVEVINAEGKKTTFLAVGTEGATISNSTIQISADTPIVGSTFARIGARITGDGTLLTELQVQAKQGTNTYATVSTVYRGTPSASGEYFSFDLANLTPETTYTYQIMNTLTSVYVTSSASFTTNKTNASGGQIVTQGVIVLDANFQSATIQDYKCAEDPKKGEYCMLAPIPFPGIVNGKMSLTTDSAGEGAVPTFINGIITFAIALAALLSALMIMWGGIAYATTEAASGKVKAKDRIRNAIFGLLLALGSFLILKTINPALVDIKLQVDTHTVQISAEDTSTGSSTEICLPKTNPPNPNNATATSLSLSTAMTKDYIPERDKITNLASGAKLSTGVKLLMTAQAAWEGFRDTPAPGTKSFRTKNPGNIGNTDKAPSVWTCSSPGIRCFDQLINGIKEQANMVERVATGKSANKAYTIGSKNDCALGNESYDGYLYQYLRIYATGARVDNNYLNAIIGYFKANGKTITAKTKMSEIYTMN